MAGHLRPAARIPQAGHRRPRGRGDLELTESARHHVFISTFSWHYDEFGGEFRRQLATILCQRRAKNPDFKVYILVDATARALDRVWDPEVLRHRAEFFSRERFKVRFAFLLDRLGFGRALG